MANDPIYLRHLGVLATLRNFLGSRYYQTVWEDFSSDAEVWNDYARRTDPQTIHRLVEQIETLLKQPPEAIDQFLADALGAAGGLYFANLQEAAAWLQRFRTHLLSVLSQKQWKNGLRD
jgi:CdiI immunity protein